MKRAGADFLDALTMKSVVALLTMPVGTTTTQPPEAVRITANGVADDCGRPMHYYSWIVAEVLRRLCARWNPHISYELRSRRMRWHSFPTRSSWRFVLQQYS